MHSLIYDKSLYAEFWGLNSEFGIFCLIVCSNFINTVYISLPKESIHHIIVQGYVPYKYISRKDCKWYVFICRRNSTIGNIPYQEGTCCYNRQFHLSLLEAQLCRRTQIHSCTLRYHTKYCSIIENIIYIFSLDNYIWFYCKRKANKK